MINTESAFSTIIDASITVKRTLGQGFLESVYQNALVRELQLRGLEATAEVPLEVRYKGAVVGFFRADILVNRDIIIETKVAEAIAPAHEYQLVNYLKVSGIDYGIIINFSTNKVEFKRKFREYHNHNNNTY